MNDPLCLCHLKEFVDEVYFLLAFLFFKIRIRVNIFPALLMSPFVVGQC